MDFKINQRIPTVRDDDTPMNMCSVSRNLFPQIMKYSLPEEEELENSIQYVPEVKHNYCVPDMENQLFFKSDMDSLEFTETEGNEIKVHNSLMHSCTSDVNKTLETSPVNTLHFGNKIKEEISMEEFKEMAEDLLSTRPEEIRPFEISENLPSAVEDHKHGKSRTSRQNMNSSSDEKDIKHIPTYYNFNQISDIAGKSSVMDRTKNPFTNRCVNMRFNANSSSEAVQNSLNKNYSETKIRCITCTKRFSNYVNYQRHIETAACQKYICPYCEKVILHATKIKLHILTHIGRTWDDFYSCAYCTKTYSRKDSLIAHIRTHIGDDPFSCAHCAKGFSRKEYLIAHIATHTGEKPFCCTQCSNMYLSKSNLRTHIQVSHAQTQVKGETSDNFKSFQCAHCIRSYFYKHDLRKHILDLHLHIKSYNCNECGKLFARRNALERHLVTHSKIKAFLCNECGRSFTREYSVKLHKKEVHGSKVLKSSIQQFICEFCGKCITSKENLQIHIRTHTKEKHFMCNFCNKKFSVKGNLEQHIRWHLKSLPHR